MLGFLKTIPDTRVRRTLFIGVLDAVTWAIMFGLAENFLVPFVLLFGATVFEVSLLQGASQLTMGLGQLAGGALIQRGGSRRRLSIIVVTYFACSWLLTYWGTVLTGNAWVAIIILALVNLATALAAQLWGSMGGWIAAATAVLMILWGGAWWLVSVSFSILKILSSLSPTKRRIAGRSS